MLDDEKTLESLLESVEEKKTLMARVKSWFRRAYGYFSRPSERIPSNYRLDSRLNSFFPGDEKSLEVYTRNRQMGGA